jgi:hypothetical protein
VGVSLSVNAGLADANDLIGAEYLAGRFRPRDREQRKDRAGRCRLFEETTSRGFLHGALSQG